MPKRPKVLIVEDDDILRRMYRTALALAGFDVQDAENGLAALQSLDHDPPDVVVLDLGLPYFSGADVRQEIAAQVRHIPVVVVTGSAEDTDALDVACVLRKPLNPDHLVAAVRSCLASGSRGIGS